jgi:hypothetical protein
MISAMRSAENISAARPADQRPISWAHFQDLGHRAIAVSVSVSVSVSVGEGEPPPQRCLRVVSERDPFVHFDHQDIVADHGQITRIVTPDRQRATEL